MSPALQAVWAALLANLIWGLSPLYYKLLAHVPPLEVLSHRTLWSLIFFAAYLALRGRLSEVAAALADRAQLIRLALAALMISCNWTLFIWAIQVDRVVETSLGYFIFPLVSVLFGVLFFGEPLGRAKLASVGLAALGVVVLTLGLGVAPVLSLVLAVTFGTYGALKKSASAGPTVSVTAEVLILSPIALLWLLAVHNLGWTGLTGSSLGTFGANLSDSLLLALSGPLTALPLILFSLASRRLSLATVGLVQYLNPTLQFLVAVALFAEPFTRAHAVAFPLIWLALAVYSVAALRQERADRRAAAASSGS